MNIDIAAIIQAIGAIVVAWFAYNQYSKNKTMDMKLTKWKNDEKKKNRLRSDNNAKVYSSLWLLLHHLKADRVYIAQPHPLIKNMFITITIGVNRNGISNMVGVVNKMQVSDVANWVNDLASRNFMLFNNIETDVKDKRAKSIMTLNGTHMACIQKLVGSDGDWVGSIFVEYTQPTKIDVVYVKALMADVANTIQFIIPEYEEE